MVVSFPEVGHSGPVHCTLGGEEGKTNKQTQCGWFYRWDLDALAMLERRVQQSLRWDALSPNLFGGCPSPSPHIRLVPLGGKN